MGTARLGIKDGFHPTWSVNSWVEQLDWGWTILFGWQLRRAAGLGRASTLPEWLTAEANSWTGEGLYPTWLSGSWWRAAGLRMDYTLSEWLVADGSSWIGEGLCPTWSADSWGEQLDWKVTLILPDWLVADGMRLNWGGNLHYLSGWQPRRAAGLGRDSALLTRWKPVTRINR